MCGLVLYELLTTMCIRSVNFGLQRNLKCPQTLVSPLVKIVIDEIRKACKKQPVVCGFNPSENAYEPLKLMQTVMAKTNEVCLRYLDNSTLCTLPAPGHPYNIVSVCAVKNTRRKMEDRHVIVHDLNTMFNIQEASPSSYYAIFDGHAGRDAAVYSAAHLHQFLAENDHFESDPIQALHDAFCKTDEMFIEKCKVEHFNSGTTAVCALLRPKEKTLYIAWVGDSQALLANQGRVLQCVEPHTPCRQDEKIRIEQEGGMVMFWGTWRVNGQLAVSRAIGDSVYKPYVSATPDVKEIPLSGTEDFLILACDGLWDFLSENDAALTVYNMVFNKPDETDSISHRLVQLAKERGSSDNISVIVVFLREPSKIAAEAHWANRNGTTMDASLDNANASGNPFMNSNGADILQPQKEGFLFDLNDSGVGYRQKQNGTSKALFSSPGKRSASEFDEDDDLGPETDVDVLDDVLLSPSIAAAKALSEGVANNNPDDVFNPFGDEKVDFDEEIQKQQSSEFDGERSPREETPTPPADAVHDAGGLVDNVAESGDESEDEWNYFKGDMSNKENVNPRNTDETIESIETDTMSQLNPDAAEFVPVSPTRSIPSPACAALINDQVISQSPRRFPGNIDISVPNPNEFDKEIKSRPSEGHYSNGHETENGQKSNTQELLENLLNGKNIDEIEFQPTGTPIKAPAASDEFHFGPNATPFTPGKILDQSEAALSTKAVFGDESTASYLDDKNVTAFESFSSEPVPSAPTEETDACYKFKGDDPMSMSFYQEKDDDSSALDLNKVHVLPDEIEDNSERKQHEASDFLSETISDLPEHNPLAGSAMNTSNINLLESEIQSTLPTTDLDIGTENPADTVSPLPPREEDYLGVCSLPKSPVGGSDSSFEHIASPARLEQELTGPKMDLFEELSHPPKSEVDDFLIPPQNVCQRPDPHSPLTELSAETLSLVPTLETKSPEPIFESKSPEPVFESKSPEPAFGSRSPEPAFLPKSPEPVFESKSSEPVFVSRSPEPLFQSKSPEPVFVSKSPEPAFESKSPEPVFQAKSPEPSSEVLKVLSETSKSPLPQEEIVEFDQQNVLEPEIPQFEDIVEDEGFKSESSIPEAKEDITLSPGRQSPVVSVDQQTEATEEVVKQVEGISDRLEEREDVISPHEETTSSVKDEISPVTSPEPTAPIEQTHDVYLQTNSVNYAQEISNAIQETVTSEVAARDELEDFLSPKSTIGDTESIATADVNSFLERSHLPDVESPLSPSDFNVEVKTVEPEYPIEELVSVSEDSVAKSPVVPEQPEFIPYAADETIIAPVVAAAAVITAAEIAKPDKKAAAKPKSSAPKKPPVKATSSPTKPPLKTTAAPSKPSAASRTSVPKTTTAPKAAPAAKPPTPKTVAPKPSPKARPAPSKVSSVTEKKTSTNGEVKPPPIRSITAKRVSDTSLPKTATSTPKLPPTKTTKPAVDVKSNVKPAPPKPPVPRVGLTKTRPTTLATKTTASSAAKAVTSTASIRAATAKPTTATSPKSASATSTTASAKPRPTTAPIRARVPLTKTVVVKNGPDTEKQIKDTVNKLTASRTSAGVRTTTTTVKKTETKSPLTRTITTKTTTTTLKSKKPETITRLSGKTKKPASPKDAKPQENGVSVVEEITIVTATMEKEPQLVKDNSPIDNNIIIDSLQCVESNKTD